ncbi:MAG: acetolactate synthase, large subunit, biosynthetic type [Candidatus Dactylopiibacterium carminicum]|uniref:Acetolactate synthase n=1 Tax=Candidatus Dactylopiibacterium carminicum TaxID=857335 RepID=A0A272ETZ9_9RHOO|nr:acetolactate synthase large subunit [Candidatus Dactylopiibacterium carminicum]KAF7599654.1 acetolactate synthase, large subunit, biosynthetic type [Candidatus Dactylopiibacterium carminicum]PAS93568.1 MAG: acetolactate synthase, large subunit, biosynthetic type [Candidatus Dactylopiibacterium carminicum]PAS99654.1 MAG: acetolactate synthase, large subunit, biosynthetic type [Candidatus Dactylopiibacterium carminicum]
MQLTGAELLVQLLEQQGITTVAGIPGGPILPFYHALAASKRIRHVLARHEQGGGFIAQGMARVSGRAAVCLASSGPGATNLLTAVADAKLDSIPLVCITAQVPSAMIGTDAFQEVDTYGISIPVTKHNWLVRDVRDLLEIIPAAFRIAESGRPGPVWVDIPKDVLTAGIEIAQLPLPSMRTPAPQVDDEQLARAAALINAARTPVLYLGGGVIAGDAAGAATAFAEQAGLPTTMTLMGLGAMPVDHPLSLGMLGMHGARYTNYALAEADLLIVLGARFDDRAIGKAAEFCPDAAVIHIDIDAAELGKIRRPDVAIQGDVATVLACLAPRVQANPRARWLERIRELKQQHPLALPGSEDVRSHYGLIRAVAGLLDEGAIIATDVGQHQMWVAQAYPFRRARQLLTSGGLGTMGFGLPAAIGAALAEPGRTVVCFSGDGSLKMNIQELDTAVEEGVNIKVVLMNNQSLGLVHQQQDLFYGQRIFAADYRRPTDFVRIAEGFGMQVFDLDAAADPRACLAQAMATRGPCLIHCSIDVNQKVFPMVPPGAANTEMIGG